MERVFALNPCIKDKKKATVERMWKLPRDGARAMTWREVGCILTWSTAIDILLKHKRVEISGKGIVHSSSCNRRLPEKGGDFNLSIVKLEEGPCMMSSVLGAEPDQVKIGTKVNARIDNTGEKPRVVFDIAKD